MSAGVRRCQRGEHRRRTAGAGVTDHFLHEDTLVELRRSTTAVEAA
ncbi:MAG: hypothetical protein WBP81_20840 [Solirubrobacteraceae bacterium]